MPPQKLLGFLTGPQQAQTTPRKSIRKMNEGSFACRRSLPAILCGERENVASAREEGQEQWCCRAEFVQGFTRIKKLAAALSGDRRGASAAVGAQR